MTVRAHSLGTVVASDGIYDLLLERRFPATLKLANVFTFGSPSALCGLCCALDQFTKPIRSLVWVNWFYPQDIIGYPLKPLNDAYKEVVTDDVALALWHSALLLRGIVRAAIAHLPISGVLPAHSWYFRDEQVASRIGGIPPDQWS